MPDAEIESGFDYLSQQFGKVNLLILKRERPWPNHKASYLMVGKADRNTDIAISDKFIQEIRHNSEYQTALMAYVIAVAARIRCGSPNSFYCSSRVAVQIEIDWPIRSGLVNGRFYSSMLTKVIDQSSSKVAHCAVAMDGLFRDYGASPFGEAELVTNRVRAAIDRGEVKFHRPDDHPDDFQKVGRGDDPEPDASPISQEELEEFVAGKAYLLGFRAVEVPSEIWVADPWDADYLRVATRDLRQSAFVLQAKGFVRLDSTANFARPSDKLVTTAWPEVLGDASRANYQQKLSLATLPKKEEALTELMKLRKNGAGLAALVIDLDHFKAVNDNKGHDEGDACLERVVQAMGGAVGRKGKLYRWGSGDEFVVILPDFSTEEARATAERIRSDVERARPGQDIAVTTSIGIAASDAVDESSSPEEFLLAADKAMYAAKHAGKNCVRVWPVPQDNSSK
jgi:diguanylate cyclase (GGDEF)-like protein